MSLGVVISQQKFFLLSSKGLFDSHRRIKQPTATSKKAEEVLSRCTLTVLRQTLSLRELFTQRFHEQI